MSSITIKSKSKFTKMAQRIWRILKKAKRTSLKKRETIKELKDALLYLAENYVSVKLEKGVLVVQTEDIYSNYYRNNLGQCVIRFDFSWFFKHHPNHFQNAIICKNQNGERFGHEHVYSDYLCAGDGCDALKKCLTDEPPRLDDFFDIIQQILRT